MTKTLFNPVSK